MRLPAIIKRQHPQQAASLAPEKLSLPQQRPILTLPPHPSVLMAEGAKHGCPPPKRPWLGRQSWQQLLLAHWAVPAAQVQALLPATITVDTSGGSAWVSVVAYRMAHVRLRGMPEALSSQFPQLNLRTYVTVNGRPGIYFFSLDAGSLLAVKTGGWVTGLPYHWAQMCMTTDGDTTQFSSRRGSGGPAVNLRYSAGRPLTDPTPLDRWLTERYVFYASRADGRVSMGAVCHGPWPLATGTVSFTQNTLGEAFGLDLSGAPDHVQCSTGVDVLFWRPIGAGD